MCEARSIKQLFCCWVVILVNDWMDFWLDSCFLFHGSMDLFSYLLILIFGWFFFLLWFGFNFTSFLWTLKIICRWYIRVPNSNTKSKNSWYSGIFWSFWALKIWWISKPFYWKASNTYFSTTKFHSNNLHRKSNP